MHHAGSLIVAAFMGLLFLWMALMLLAEILAPLFVWWEDRQPKCPCGCGITARRARQLDQQK